MIPYIVGGLLLVGALKKQKQKVRRHRGRVGQYRTPAQGMTPLDWEELATRDWLTALNSFDCPEELWRRLAQTHPIEAEDSPLFRSFGVSLPGFRSRVSRVYRNAPELLDTWMPAYFRSLPEKTQRLFAADCAELVLEVFESERPKDKRPRLAVEAARAFAKGEWTMTKGRLNRAAVAAYAAALDARHGSEPPFIVDDLPAGFAATAASRAAGRSDEIFDCIQQVVNTAAAQSNSRDRSRNQYLAKAATWDILKKYIKEQNRPAQAKALYDAILKQLAQNLKEMHGNAFREEYYGSETPQYKADLDKKIQKAVNRAMSSAQQIATANTSPEASSFPEWIGWGLIGVSTVTAAILIGPEILAAAGVTEGVSLLEVLAAAGEAAGEITAVARASSVTTVSMAALVDALEADMALAELSGGSAFLEGLVAKLAANRITVTGLTGAAEEVVQLVAKVAR